MATVKDGECKAFKRIAVEACGLTQADQDVIDDKIEEGVAACRWKRPAAHTPSCADLRAEIAELRRSVGKPAPASVAPAKKPPLWRRMLHRPDRG